MARPTKFDDEQVLDSTVDLLWREGCDAVTIRSLEVALDLKAPSIYRRFGSREHLVVRSIEHYRDRYIRNGIGRYLGESTDPIAALRRVFEIGTSDDHTLPHPRGCLVITTACQVDANSPQIRHVIDGALGEIRAIFRATLDRAQRLGQVRADLSCDALTELAFTTFQGLRVLARTDVGSSAAAIDALFRMLAAPASA